jgi:1-deoxy-D-xylulose-5-phosphate reductoisomerase
MSRSTTNLVLLGSTGSIGVQTLDVVARLRHDGKAFRVVGLSAHTNHELLAEQIEAVCPRVVALAAGEGARWLRERFPHVRVLEGEDGLAELAAFDGVDVVVNAIVGAAGLAATLAALSCGRTVALANKESLVIGGPLVRAALERHGGRLIPVDSEHSALLQCLDAGRRGDVRRLILTASGGPFLNLDPAARASATVGDALRHPTWSMGKRITVDSATLVNKAFEVIEAHVLFDVPYDRISTVIHPESIVHSLVEFRDGSILAQAATHDMRIPIQYALTYPERVDTGLPRLDIAALGRLEFRRLDEEQFPAFATVLAAALAGGSAPAAVNAADEVLVERFLRGDIVYEDLAIGLAVTLDRWRTEVADDNRRLDLTAVESADRWARSIAVGLGFDHR